MTGNGSTGRLYPLARGLLRPATKFVWPAEVEGLEHVPAEGGAIIAPNHISFLDSVVLIGVLPRRITYVGKAEYLDNWKTRFLFPAVGMIPIDRTGGKSVDGRPRHRGAACCDRVSSSGSSPRAPARATACCYRGRTGIARLALRTGAPDRPRRHRRHRPHPAAGRFGAPALQALRRALRRADRDRPLRGAGQRRRACSGSSPTRSCSRSPALSGQQYVDRYAERKADRAADSTRRAAARPPRAAGQPAGTRRDLGHCQRGGGRMTAGRAAVVGGGSWGTALAAVLAERHDVDLWALEPEVVEGINDRHENPLFHPGAPLPPRLRASGRCGRGRRGRRGGRARRALQVPPGCARRPGRRSSRPRPRS